MCYQKPARFSLHTQRQMANGNWRTINLMLSCVVVVDFDFNGGPQIRRRSMKMAKLQFFCFVFV